MYCPDEATRETAVLVPLERAAWPVDVCVLVSIFLGGSHRYRTIDRWLVEVVSSEWILEIDRDEGIGQHWFFDDRMNLCRIWMRQAASSPNYQRGSRWTFWMPHAVEQEGGSVWWISSADRTVRVMRLNHSNRLSRPVFYPRNEEDIRAVDR